MNKKGYIVIEALIAVLVLSMVVLSIFSTMSFLTNRGRRSSYESDANLLLQEGMEVAHGAITSNISQYPEGTYFPAYDTNTDSWILLPGTEENIRTRFERSVEIKNVCRDPETGVVITTESDTCTGVIDDKSKLVSTKIAWRDGKNDKEIEAKLLVVKISND